MGWREGVAALAAALLASAPAVAELSQPVPLADIGSNPTTVQPLYEWSGAIQFVPLAGATFFDAWEGARGNELWRSDGTPAGTFAVRDLCPGACNGRESPELVVSAGALWFQGNDGAHGFELWKSDGTAAGTTLVKDIGPGFASSFPTFLTPAPGGLYFVADDGTHGQELWFSDGTAAGTQLVADLLPGDPDPIPNVRDALGPTHLTTLGSVLLFAAEDDVNGRELWRTDGTLAGTTLVEDIVPGAGGGIYAIPFLPFWEDRPVVAGGLMFFAGRVDGTIATVPWASDGTAAGTVALVASPASTWQTHAFFAFDDDVLFSGGESGNRTLWRSDGTPGGTAPLGSAANGGERLGPSAFARLGDLVYFDGFQLGAGSELWVTDGTEAGTHLVTEIGAGAASGVFHFGFVAGGGRVFFHANDGSGAGLWASDGTAAGTAMVSDLDPGTGNDIIGIGGASPTYPAAIGEHLFFRGWDGEQWSTRTLDLEGGAQQTLHDSSDPAGSMAFCCPSAVPHENGFAFVAVDSTHGGEPWVTDGTAGGTALAADVFPGVEASIAWPTEQRVASVPGKLLFIANADGNSGTQLWSFDGAAVTQITNQPLFAGPGTIASWNESAFFGMDGGVWRTDGTVAGTVELQPSGNAGGFTPVGDRLYFVAGGGPWVTDGTAAGTHRVAPSVNLFAGRLMAAKDEQGAARLYFFAAGAAAGTELWVSDGTDGGTRLVVDLRAGSAGSIPAVYSTWQEEGPILAGLGSKALFVADDGMGAGVELWVSDGSPGNATLLEVRPGAAGSDPRWLTTVGDRVYFVADDGVHGRELWVTDGTLAGTHLAADVRPGADSAMPTSFEAWNGQLFFAADDGVHGMELWGTTGAGGAAELVVDLRPGVAPSSPQGLTKNGDALMFFADDGTTGVEPWAIFVRRPLIADAFESGDLDKWSTRTSPP